MPSTIYTIGFTQKTAEEFFGLLQDAGVEKLIDIRENRVGQLSGFAKYPDLAFFLDRLCGIAYAYQPLFAPSVEIRTAFQTSLDWTRYEQSFRELIAQRNAIAQLDFTDFVGTVALLCSEPTAEKCHRRLIAEMLAEHWTAQGQQVEIKHLVSAKSPRKKREL